jgi:hypothetical protein
MIPSRINILLSRSTSAISWKVGANFRLRTGPSAKYLELAVTQGRIVAVFLN